MTEYFSPLGAVQVRQAVGGSAEVVLAKHRTENRMVPLIRYCEPDGTVHAIELSTPDVNSLMASLIRLHAAEAPEVAEWYRELTAQR